MKVYIVCHDIEYEGSVVKGAYASRSKAEAVAQEWNTENKMLEPFEEWSVEEYEVIED